MPPDIISICLALVVVGVVVVVVVVVVDCGSGSGSSSSSSTVAAAAVVDRGRLLTRRPYRVHRDISNAFFVSSVRTPSGRLTLPKMSSRAAAVPEHSVSQCSAVSVCGSSPHWGPVGSIVRSIRC